MSTVTREIDGLQAHCNPLPYYPTGATLGLELAAIAAPALAGIAPKIEGAKVDLSEAGAMGKLLKLIDARELLDGVADALKKLVYEDSARFKRVSGQLLRGVSVELPGDDGTKMVTLDSETSINRALAGAGYGRLLKLIWFALEANFGDFFGAVSGGTSPAGGPSFRQG